MKIAIIGGVAGGAGTAARLRRLDEKTEIILFERGENLSYANCGLPYYIGDTIKEKGNLFVVSNQLFMRRFNIDVRTSQEVMNVDIHKKTLLIKKIDTREVYHESYDKLVLSPGAEPILPNIKGINSERIFTLRDIPNADSIKHFISQYNVKDAIVVGAGFIGLEMTENLCHLGINVTLIEMEKQVMAPLDYSMATIVHQHLKQQRVNLMLEKSVVGFEDADNHIKVGLRSGKIIETDMVVWCVGVRPEIKLAKDAGLEIGDLGGIKVDEYMQTSNPDIYALGDAVEVIHPITGKPSLIPLAGPANKQARIVADNIVLGNKHIYKGTYGVSVAKVFDLTLASVGANAKLLQKAGVHYQSSYTHAFSHASYYPGAMSLSIKIIFSPNTGQLIGAQVVGFDGVDKRIEMLAGVIQRRGTVTDLCELEHAYAPPYSSAKDSVNMAGLVADNVLTGKLKVIHWRDVDKDSFLLDVRMPKEYEAGHIEGSVNIPVDELRQHLDEIPKDRKVIIYCASGFRSYVAYRILLQSGFHHIVNLSGGYKTYQVATAKI